MAVAAAVTAAAAAVADPADGGEMKSSGRTAVAEPAGEWATMSLPASDMLWTDEDVVSG